jgi:hypothetical protein
MARRASWPDCSVPNCGCRRTWETEDDARAAMLRHMTTWVMDDWEAICLCHGPLVATFPCDKSLRMTHSA